MMHTDKTVVCGLRGALIQYGLLLTVSNVGLYGFEAKFSRQVAGCILQQLTKQQLWPTTQQEK
jgi:hypothetical protein